MMPNPQTVFLPLSDLESYTDRGYFCCAIVFSPDTENSHFMNCPPYISLSDPSGNEDVYFRVPEAVAYYGTVHAGYTMKGKEQSEEWGRRKLQEELRDLLGINDD